MSETSQALKNIRSFAIVAVVSFHSLLAYLASQRGASAPFDRPPYHWMAIPIVDRERWFGFDLYSAFNYMSLMPLMFLLSGLFVLPSLRRKGVSAFVRERLVRLGLPLVFGLFFLMPLAYYPVYRLSAVNPSFVAFFRQWLALPVWPAGPLWFLWQLLALDLIFAAVFLLIPRSTEPLAQLATQSSSSGRRCFILLLVASAAAYIPLALMFGPWNWIYFGPTAIQPDRVLLYGIYFLAGVGIGAYGLQNALLSTEGPLARHWRVWLAAAAGGFVLWMICMAPLQDGDAGILLSFAAYFSVALLVTSACFCFIAVSLRFATGQSAVCNSLSDNAYRIYVVHYLFVVWLQYLLLGTSLPAIMKGAAVFAGTLALSWGIAAALGQVIPFVKHVPVRGMRAITSPFAPWMLSRDRLRGATRHDVS